MRTALIVLVLAIVGMLAACQCGLASVTVENNSDGEVTVVVDDDHWVRVPPGLTATIHLPGSYSPGHIEVRREDVVVFSITLETPTNRFDNMHLVINDNGVRIADADEGLAQD